MTEFDYSYEERQRVIKDGTYIPFYIENPIEDLEVTISDEALDVITVSCQIVDPGGDAIEERVLVRLVLFTDENYDTLDAALGNLVITATTGLEVEVNNAGTDIEYLTDEEGALVLSFDDTTDDGDKTTYLGFILPNGKFVEGGEVTFADDTP